MTNARRVSDTSAFGAASRARRVASTMIGEEIQRFILEDCLVIIINDNEQIFLKILDKKDFSKV